MHSERLFRPERRTRDDTNVFPLQPIDAASWIWRAGEDRWGAAAFADTHTSPEALAAAPPLETEGQARAVLCLLKAANLLDKVTE